MSPDDFQLNTDDAGGRPGHGFRAGFLEEGAPQHSWQSQDGSAHGSLPALSGAGEGPARRAGQSMRAFLRCFPEPGPCAVASGWTLPGRDKEIESPARTGKAPVCEAQSDMGKGRGRATGREGGARTGAGFHAKRGLWASPEAEGPPRTMPTCPGGQGTGEGQAWEAKVPEMERALKSRP